MLLAHEVYKRVRNDVIYARTPRVHVVSQKVDLGVDTQSSTLCRIVTCKSWYSLVLEL